MQEWDENERDGGTLITNPPYGERLRPADMETLYRQLGETLKFHFQGWHAWILGYKEEHFSAIGLKPSVKFPILNGSLECSLREYVLFSGKYNEFKADGGSVHNADFNRVSRPKTHHKSDAEWAEETRPFRQKGDRKSKERSEFRRNDDRKDFRRNDFGGREERGDFKRRDSRNSNAGFKRRDSRDSRFRDSDDRSEFKRRDDRKRDKPTRGGAREINDRGPRLGEEHTTFSSPVFMRTRKPWKKNRPATEDTED